MARVKETAKPGMVFGLEERDPKINQVCTIRIFPKLM